MAEDVVSLFGTGKNGTVSEEDALPRSEVGGKAGLLPSQHIEALLKRKKVRAADDIAADQVQPASLDLRLGAKAYRVRASFLPGRERSVLEQLATLKQHEIALDGGAVLEQGCVYLVELQEQLELPPTIAAIANPKSSTGRIDVFTRLIADHSEAFDWVEAGYCGPLYAEIFPRTFSIKVRKGSRLNQIRFLRRTGSQDRYWRPSLSDAELRAQDRKTPLIDGEAGKATIRFGLNVRVDLKGEGKGATIGYRALRYTEVLDVDGKGAHDRKDFWEPIRSPAAARLILNPNQFYILASKERISVPPAFAAEMIPIDPMMGEFRAHYAGFFDPGFGSTEDGGVGSKAVLEVRTLDVPFVLEDGQIIARLVYEQLADVPDKIYGRDVKSHYQGQGLKLSKHFR
jgi:dCTP deaminase